MMTTRQHSTVDHRTSRSGVRNRNHRQAACGRRRCRHSRLECLESRRLLAGDVQVVVQDGSLLIAGDNLDNGVAMITGPAPNQFVITGVHNNGATTINGQWQQIVEVTGDMLINLRDGDDSFFFNADQDRNVNLPGQLRILGRGGNDHISLTSIDAVFDIHGKTQIDTGTGDDIVEVHAEGQDAAIAVNDNLSILTRDGDDEVSVEAIGNNASITIPGRLAIFPGNNSDDVKVAASEGDSVVSVGNLKVSDPHGEDSVTLQAFRDNASLTVNGILNIETNVGEDRVRVTAFHDNAQVTLMNDATIKTGDSEDAVLVEAEFGSAVLTVNGDLRLNGGNDADLLRLFANQDSARILTRQYVKMDTGDSGLFAGGDYAMILASHHNASITFEKNVLIRTGNSPDLQNHVLVKASDDNATLNFGRDLTIRADDSPQSGAVVDVIAGGGNGSGAAQVNVAENLRILSGSGTVDVTIAALSDQATVSVGNDLRIYMGGGSNDVQLITSSEAAQLVVADDLRVELGDSDDSLMITGVTILDKATLNGQAGLDSFVESSNQFGSLSAVDFEV